MKTFVWLCIWLAVCLSLWLTPSFAAEPLNTAEATPDMVLQLPQPEAPTNIMAPAALPAENENTPYILTAIRKRCDQNGCAEGQCTTPNACAAPAATESTTTTRNRQYLGTRVKNACSAVAQLPKARLGHRMKAARSACAPAACAPAACTPAACDPACGKPQGRRVLRK